MVSEMEIEAACRAFLVEYGDPSAEWWDYRKEVTAALEAAARVRAENDAFRDAVVTGLGAVKMNADGSAERIDLRAEPSGKIKEAAQIIQAFIDQEVDYMTRNNLGDPEKQHNVKWGRKWLSSLTAGKPEQVPSGRPETVESVLLDALRKIASTDLSGCANMTTAEIFGALSRMHETARRALEEQGGK